MSHDVLRVLYLALFNGNIPFKGATVYHDILANLASEPWVAKIRIAKIN